MAQLVVKRDSSWWATPFAKHTMFWVPVAGFQAATLVGLGYFYERVTDIETQLGSYTGGGTVSRAKPVTVTSTQSMSAAGPVSLNPAFETGLARNTMLVGERFSSPQRPAPSVDIADPVEIVSIPVPEPVKADFSVEAGSSQRPARVHTKPVSPSRKLLLASAPVKQRKETPKTMAVVKPATSVVLDRDLEAERTATANREGIDQPVMTVAETVATTELPWAEDDPSIKPFGGAPTPVGVVTWIYIGELRDYGWHGQKLHVAPGSGLPEVGQNYRTQMIHGLYQQPYGKRAMGGFQQGDTVTVLEVAHEVNNDVWAKVRKVHSVGH